MFADEFNSPQTAPDAIWRFLDLKKFLRLLHSSSLYFARGDQFQDPYEGMPIGELVDVIETLRSTSPGAPQDLPQHYDAFSKTRSDLFVSCWHASPHENAAMWKL